MRDGPGQRRCLCGTAGLPGGPTGQDVKVNAADPGQTATDFTGGLGHSVADGAESIVTLATIGPDGPTGQFIDRSGILPW